MYYTVHDCLLHHQFQFVIHTLCSTRFCGHYHWAVYFGEVSLNKSKVSEVLFKDFGYELGPERCTLQITDRKAGIPVASNRPLK
jgi:hypothetical protein